MDENRERVDALLDWLADEVAQRLAARQSRDTGQAEAVVRQEMAAAPEERLAPAMAVTQPLEEITPLAEGAPEDTLPIVREGSPSHAAALMARLALGLLVAIVLINIPLNMQGTALARSIPSSAALIIRDGLVVKEAASPEVYVYRNGAFHWITSLEAFDYFGYRWENVHIVDPGFLGDFDQGKPIYVLLKCDGSPHIYRLEAGQKRWIIDIPTFEAEGYVWEDVKMVSCAYLRSLPDGDSIPPGQGSPPPPLP